MGRETRRRNGKCRECRWVTPNSVPFGSSIALFVTSTFPILPPLCLTMSLDGLALPPARLSKNPPSTSLIASESAL
ncbi:hypothetical protein BC826DRAFT_997043 [Russula brevipes]|nr:hypothetical protein BC826DRAFT_997043 [Russula brevipes]